MGKLTSGLLTLAILILAGVNRTEAATPEQAGVYKGLMKGKSYDFSFGDVEPKTEEFTLTINEDNTYSLAYKIFDFTGIGAFGKKDGSIHYTDGFNFFTLTIHFRGGKIKGGYHQGDTSSGGALVEGKFKLIKQPAS